MAPNVGEGAKFETLRSSAKVFRYGDSYAIVLFDVPREYVGRKVASFEFVCCDTRYTYNRQRDPRRWIRIIEFRRVRLNGVFVAPAIRVPLGAAVTIHDVLSYLHKSKAWITAEVVVVLP